LLEATDSGYFVVATQKTHTAPKHWRQKTEKGIWGHWGYISVHKTPNSLLCRLNIAV
jgi:nicotinamidase-related amidase